MLLENVLPQGIGSHHGTPQGTPWVSPGKRRGRNGALWPIHLVTQYPRGGAQTSESSGALERGSFRKFLNVF